MRRIASRWRTLSAVLGLVVSAGCGGTTASTASPDAPSVPYVLFAPLDSTMTYLMDLQGQVVHAWRSVEGPSLSVYLLPNGLLLRPRSLGASSFPAGGGNGGRVEELNWDGSVAWSFDYFSTTFQQHHDVRWMPNGHVLLVAWEKKTPAEVVAVGRDPSTIPSNGEVWVDHVVEVDPTTNQVVWQWHLWDHLLPPGADPLAHPELVDPNAHTTATTSDWTHVNAVDYNSALDQVMLSVRNHSEIWIIDHGTTTAEAAGHSGGRSGRGGDLLYRWGNPGAYGLAATQQLFGQHNAHWIDDGLPGAGDVLLFDNGDSALRAWSSAVQLAPTVLPDGNYLFDGATGFAPAAPDWEYTATPPESLFASIVSSAQRLASGNTLLCDGPAGHIFEVSPAGDTVWSYRVTDTTGATGVRLFRATRYEGDYSGLAGQALEPQGPLQVELAP